MCRSHSLPAWQAQCLRQAMEIEGAELALAVIESPNNSAASNPNEAKKTGFFFIWKSAQRRLASILPALQPTSLECLIGSIPVIDCRAVNHSGQSSVFEDGDIKKIKALDLDFIIRFGPGRIEGDILGATRFGVWFFQLGEDGFQGEPPGFWEIYRGCRLSCSSLRCFGAKGKSDAILKSGQFRTINASYSANLSQLLTESSRWLAQACRELLNGEGSYKQNPTATAGYSEGGEPSNLVCLIFYLRLHRNKLVNFCNNLFIHRHWGLALSFSPVQDLWLHPNDARVAFLPRPSRDTFHSDPFGLEYENGLAILYERWSNVEGLGRISCFFLNKKTLDEFRLASSSETSRAVSAPRTVSVNMKFPHHCSYPFVFSHEGQYYCIPETGEAARASLYQCVGSPGEWTHMTDIITDFAAVDSSVIHYAGRWWLFCTNKDDNPNSHLYLWYADELSGPWKAHLNNPVKMDICSARPAGTPFEHEGVLYRPAQDNSRNYGGSITIQRITELSPVSFSEESCGDLKCLSDVLKVDGMHTLSRVGDFTVLDYYKRAFLPSILVYRLKLYLQSKRKS